MNGKNYRGRENTHQIPTQKNIEISYLLEDPSISSIDPSASLAFQKGLNESQLGLWIGLGGMLLGGYLLYTRIKRLIRKTA